MKNSFLLLALLLLAACKTNTTNISHPLQAQQTEGQMTEIRKAEIDSILKGVHEADQAQRTKAAFLLMSGADGEAFSKAYLPVIEQDKKNREVALPIIDEIIRYQLPDLNPDSYTTCYLVIQHAPTEIQKRYVPFTELLYQKGYIDTTKYMWFIDRVNEGENKAQKYGTQTVKSFTGIMYAFPVSSNYLTAWEELDCKFSPSLWAGLTYPPIEVSPEEFAFIVFVTTTRADGYSSEEGTEGVRIVINDTVQGLTDSRGYFSCKTRKTDVPEKIRILYGEKSDEYRLENTEGSDFAIIRYELPEED